MSPLVVALFVLGFVAGPVLDELAISTGAGEPRRWAPRCPGCGELLPLSRWWTDTCPRCGRPRGRRVVVVSSVFGAVLAAVPTLGGLQPAVLPAYAWFLGLTVSLVLTDLDHRRIPNRLSYPGIVIGGVLLGAGRLLAPTSGSLLRALVAAAVVFGGFLVLGVLARGGLGMGDVKLMAVIGLYLGYRGWDLVVLGVVFGALLGGIPALVLLATRRAGRKDELAYGPPLILGAWVALAIGRPFLAWYLG